MKPEGPSEFTQINAKTFQTQLSSLGNTIALKVQREAVKVLDPAYAATDIYVMLRQSLAIYHLFFFLNSDERREKEAKWTVYSAAVLPLVRCMIDSLYNITAILGEPDTKGREFRESGYKLILEGLDADEKEYGGRAEWDDYIERHRRGIRFDMRVNRIDEARVQAARRWPTLGKYLWVKKGQSPTPHQVFLKSLTFGWWREYSSMAHVTFNGLVPTALFFTTSDIPFDERSKFEDVSDRAMSMHITRVASMLLCTLTEIQAHFRFDDARIDERLHEVWNALLPAFEVRELYDARYAKLMKGRGNDPR